MQLHQGKNIRLSKNDLDGPTNVELEFHSKRPMTKINNAIKKGSGLVIKISDIKKMPEIEGGSLRSIGRRLRRGFNRVGSTLGNVTNKVIDFGKDVTPEIAGVATKEAIKAGVAGAVMASTGNPALSKIAAASVGNVVGGEKIGSIAADGVEKHTGKGLNFRRIPSDVIQNTQKMHNELKEKVVGRGRLSSQKNQLKHTPIYGTQGGLVSDRFDKIVDNKTKMAYVSAHKKGGYFRTL